MVVEINPLAANRHDDPVEKSRKQAHIELMQCSASKYKSFLDTVQLDLTGNRELKHFLANEKTQKNDLSLRTFIACADAQERLFKELDR